eukprot:Nk52_evm1s2249 gene=Nk52_evmTU1s2249
MPGLEEISNGFMILPVQLVAYSSSGVAAAAAGKEQKREEVEEQKRGEDHETEGATGGEGEFCVDIAEKYRVGVNSNGAGGVVKHELYFKQHKGNDNGGKTPTDRTVFVMNIPEGCSAWALRKLFRGCGKISSDDQIHFNLHKQQQEKSALGLAGRLGSSDLVVNYESSERCTKSAHVVFNKSSSLKKCLKLSQKVTIASQEGENKGKKKVYRQLIVGMDSACTGPLNGMKKWAKGVQSVRVGAQTLQEGVDKFMAEYDIRVKKEQEERRREIERNNAADADGWQTVTRSSKRKRTDTDKIAAESAKSKKKKAKNEMLDFYKFQQREKKREEIAELRKKFEEDKAKIVRMRATRKFKPF